ncbi:MAG: hypothetical protein ACPLRY_08855 [Candidatus Bathyarchaeales archaeon]
MSEVKKAFLAFHYAEKIKTNLIMTSALLEFLSGLADTEIAGAEKLLITYFNALIAEVNIAANASQIEVFRDITAKLNEAVEQTRQHNYANAERLVSEAISITTTQRSGAAQALKDKGII